MSQYSNVKWDNEGYTFMDLDRMMTLMDQVERCGRKNSISLYDLIPDNASPMTEVLVRTAANAPEYYGGMRMDGVRGSGDTICRTENMPHVYQKAQNTTSDQLDQAWVNAQMQEPVTDV